MEGKGWERRKKTGGEAREFVGPVDNEKDFLFYGEWDWNVSSKWVM